MGLRARSEFGGRRQVPRTWCVQTSSIIITIIKNTSMEGAQQDIDYLTLLTETACAYNSFMCYISIPQGLVRQVPSPQG